MSQYNVKFSSAILEMCFIPLKRLYFLFDMYFSIVHITKQIVKILFLIWKYGCVKTNFNYFTLS